VEGFKGFLLESIPRHTPNRNQGNIEKLMGFLLCSSHYVIVWDWVFLLEIFPCYEFDGSWGSMVKSIGGFNCCGRVI